MERNHTACGPFHVGARGKCCEELQKRCRAAKQQFLKVCTVARRHPSCILLPLTLAALIGALGSWAVYEAGKNAASSKRGHVEAMAKGVATALMHDFTSTAMPLYAVSALVRLNPNWTYWDTHFMSWAQQLTDEAAELSPGVIYLRLQPRGRMLPTSVWPAWPNITQGEVEYWDNMNGSTSNIPRFRDYLHALTAITEGQLVAQYNSASTSQLRQNTVTVRLPIYIANATENEMFGIDFQPFPCPEAVEPYCYNASSSTKWWGFASAIIDTDVLLAPEHGVSTMQQLTDSGLDYVLSVQPLDFTTCCEAVRPVAEGFHVPSRTQVISSSLSKGERLTQPVSEPVRLPDGTRWMLSVAPTEGTWEPAWRKGLWGLVAALAVLVPGLVCAVMTSKAGHLDLLRDLMPAEAARCIKSGAMYAESYEGVTLMFTDIVSYTHLSSGMTPEALVGLLNAVYHAADVLSAKHGMYKVETIGDALFMVAGCPNRCSVKEGAARAARMALDWVDWVSKYRDGEGRTIQVRVGLHTGPITAAVVGKAVHYSLFGDAVNVASRMESASVPGRVLATETTAQLLEDCPDVQLVPRGVIEVKGKGPMRTSWVQRSDELARGQSMLAAFAAASAAAAAATAGYQRRRGSTSGGGSDPSALHKLHHTKSCVEGMASQRWSMIRSWVSAGIFGDGRSSKAQRAAPATAAAGGNTPEPSPQAARTFSSDMDDVEAGTAAANPKKTSCTSQH